MRSPQETGPRRPASHRHQRGPDRRLFLAALALLVLALLPPFGTDGLASSLQPRHVRSKAGLFRITPGHRTDRLVVKFREGMKVRLRNGRLSAPASPPAAHDLAAVEALLASHPEARIERLLHRSEAVLDTERQQAQNLSRRELADLNNYYEILVEPATVQDAEEILSALNALPLVELAYAEPRIFDAGLPRDLEAPVRPRIARPADGRTPLFVDLQEYLGPAPIGVDATAAWAYPGGNGLAVTLVDVETGYNWSHEDLKVPFFEGGPPVITQHGCAVAGILVGQPNPYGITGIAHRARIGARTHEETPMAEAVDEAAAQLQPGDLLVLETQVAGPLYEGGGTQDGLIPLEWHQAHFDIISQATARGVVCVAAAGNGAQDLDDPIYEGLFDRNVRDSGSIIVGAAHPSSQIALTFSNYGSRIDLNGWGVSVVTSGYGDLYGEEPDEFYTDTFGGTSSATAIVSGAVAALQGAYKAAHGGQPLIPGTLTEILVETGTPQTGQYHVGPRPNLALAVPLALGELVHVGGSVSDAATGAGIADAEVRVKETGARVVTGTSGAYTLSLTLGTWTLTAAAFGYDADSQQVSISAGESLTRGFPLARQPRGILSGHVRDELGLPVAGATISLKGAPLSPATSDAAGAYSIPQVPLGLTGFVEAAVEGRAPDIRAVEQFDPQRPVDLVLAAPEEFEDGDGGFLPAGDWEWGVPSGDLGPAAHSGDRCWGTNLSGRYAPETEHTLTIGPLDLAGVTDPRVAFWQWYAFWDLVGANAQVSDDGGATWSVLPPVDGYLDPCIHALGDSAGCAPGLTNASDGWVPAVFDLSEHAEESVWLRLRLAPCREGQNGPGWYIDDYALFGTIDPSGVPGSAGFATFLSPPEPNPTSGRATLRLNLGRPARVNLALYSVGGRLVRSILGQRMDAGSYRVEWNGRDQQGRPVASGVYLLRLNVGGEGLQPERQPAMRLLVIR